MNYGRRAVITFQRTRVCNVYFGSILIFCFSKQTSKFVSLFPLSRQINLNLRSKVSGASHFSGLNHGTDIKALLHTINFLANYRQNGVS